MKYKLINYYPPYTKKDIGKIVWFGPNNILGPENYPEFWEKVVEKDYEILSLIFNKYGNLIKKDTILTKNNDNFENLLEHGCWNIHSVKRLSDGEIFTISDKLNKSYISNILLQQDIIWLMCQGNSINSKLNDAVKIKQPLFTTEDGVDIFEGDYCYFVRSTLKPIEEPFLVTKQFWKGNLDYYKWFSTKEKAEEYILMNKPILSLKEIYDLTDKNSGQYNESDLEKLVKQKLNK